MKKWLVLIWLLVGVGLLSYQAGPGQEALAWKYAKLRLKEAKEFQESGHYDEAIEKITESISTLPTPEEPEEDLLIARNKLRLAQLQNTFQLGKLAETLEGLILLVEEVEKEHGAQSEIAFEVREFLGRVYYHAMVALRLEAAEEAVWVRCFELARQNYRFLAENTKGSRNKVDRKNLEVVIKSFNEEILELAAAASASADTTGLAELLEEAPEAEVEAEVLQPNDARPRDAPEDFPDLQEWEFDLGS